MNQLDLTALAGRKVFFEKEYIADSQDGKYLLSSLRQRIMASGAILQENKEEAEYIVEVRVGAFGTDQSDLLVGVSESNVPTSLTSSVTIPEISLFKQTDQKGVLKMVLFVIHRETGRIVWQSGELMEESNSKSLWAFGAGPFQWGDIHDGTQFVGERLRMPELGDSDGTTTVHELPNIGDQAFYVNESSEVNPLIRAARESKSTDTPSTDTPSTSASTENSNAATDAANTVGTTETAKTAGTAEATETAKTAGTAKATNTQATSVPPRSSPPPKIPITPAW